MQHTRWSAVIFEVACLQVNGPVPQPAWCVRPSLHSKGLCQLLTACRHKVHVRFVPELYSSALQLDFQFAEWQTESAAP